MILVCPVQAGNLQAHRVHALATSCLQQTADSIEAFTSDSMQDHNLQPLVMSRQQWECQVSGSAAAVLHLCLHMV